MSHDPHTGPPDAVLYDGCAECADRARNPMEALLRLDRESTDVLWRRMVSVERTGGIGYRSRNEALVGKHLYYWAVFEERNGHDPRDVWSPNRFAL